MLQVEIKPEWGDISHIIIGDIYASQLVVVDPQV